MLILAAASHSALSKNLFTPAKLLEKLTSINYEFVLALPLASVEAAAAFAAS